MEPDSFSLKNELPLLHHMLGNAPANMYKCELWSFVSASSQAGQRSLAAPE
jgi:hypothetical protein